jgi:hypothetical protein
MLFEVPDEFGRHTAFLLHVLESFDRDSGDNVAFHKEVNCLTDVQWSASSDQECRAVRVHPLSSAYCKIWLRRFLGRKLYGRAIPDFVGGPTHHILAGL